MGIDSISGAGQNDRLWQLMQSSLNSALTERSNLDGSSSDRPEGIGQFLGRMEQLRSSDSPQLQAVLSEIAIQLQGASQQSDGAVSDILSLIANGFQSVSDSSDLASFLSGSSGEARSSNMIQQIHGANLHPHLIPAGVLASSLLDRVSRRFNLRGLIEHQKFDGLSSFRYLPCLQLEDQRERDRLAL
jgi:hypothetical protein